MSEEIEYLFAYDGSGSTGNCDFYHHIAQNEIEPVLNGKKSKRVLWDTMCRMLHKDELKLINTRKGGFGGTSPVCVAELIKKLNFHGTLIFQTDGQVGLNCVSKCNNILKDWKFEKVIVYLIDTGSKIEESCSISFTRNSPHIIKIYEKNNNEYRVKILETIKEKYLLLEKIEEITTIEDFLEKIPELEKILISVNMGLEKNPVLHEKFTKLKNNLIKIKSENKKILSVDDFMEEPNVTNLQKVWFDYYKDPNEWSIYIDKFISWCNGGLLNVFDRSMANRELKKEITIAVKSETAEIIEDVEVSDLKIVCPITLENSSNIIILLKRGDRSIFKDLDKNFVNSLINNPLCGLHNEFITKFIKSVADCVCSIEAYKQLVEYNLENNSPMTREFIEGGICLGCDMSHVKATNSSIRHVFLGGKSLGNIDLWFAVFYFIVNRGDIPHLTEFLPMIKAHLIYRLEKSKTYMCLTGLNTYPTYKVSLKLSLYSVIFSSSFVINAKQEPLRIHLDYTDSIIELLKLVNIDIPCHLKKHIIRLKVFRYFMNELKKGNNLSNLVDALKFNAIETKKKWVLIDGSPTESQIFHVRILLPEICDSLENEEIYDIFKMCDRNKAESDIYIPFNFGSSKFTSTKIWHYDLQQPNIHISICINTCRPYSKVIHDGLEIEWLVKAKEIYGKNFMSITNLFGVFVVTNIKYPTKEEFLIYLSEYYSTRNYKTLPVCISQFIDEIFEDYKDILSYLEPNIFSERWINSKHNNVRLKME